MDGIEGRTCQIQKIVVYLYIMWYFLLGVYSLGFVIMFFLMMLDGIENIKDFLIALGVSAGWPIVLVLTLL